MSRFSSIFSKSSKITKLQEIPASDLPTLRDLFRTKWPTNVISYNLIDNLIWQLQGPQKDKNEIKVYSVEDAWKKNGTFVAVMRENEIVFGTLDTTFEHLKKSLKLLDYSKTKTLLSVSEIYRPIVQEVVKENNLQVLYDFETNLKYLKNEDAKNIEVKFPKGLKLGPLNESHAVKINDVWPKKTEGSEEAVRSLINNNLSMGLFTDKNEIVAWCLQMDTGSLAVLQTDENHLRKGYGEIVTRALIKKIATQRNQDLTSNVESSNVMSTGLFKKLGFQDIDNNFWMMVAKKN